MNLLSHFIGSVRLTAALLIITAISLLVGERFRNQARLDWIEAEKGNRARDQAFALTNAIEQYFVDFPDAGPPANNHDWTERLGGHNPKSIRYLKVEKYSHDSQDRLVDPCGVPYVIETQETPGFKADIPEQALTEFHVRSDGCVEGLATGDRHTPQYPRSWELMVNENNQICRVCLVADALAADLCD